jgi:hypothetical protein
MLFLRDYVNQHIIPLLPAAPLPAEALEALGSNPDTAAENIPDDLPF